MSQTEFLCRFAEENKYKPLTEAELRSGKSKVKIYGRPTLIMPWKEVYTRIASNQPLEEIGAIYGNLRKIVMWAIEDGIGILPELEWVLASEVKQRRVMAKIEESDPVVAMTLKEMTNEVAPDVTRIVALASKELIDKGRELIKTADANDLVNIAKAIQTSTDTLEITVRHANAANLTTNHIAVTGFSFIADTPDVALPETIEEECVDAVVFVPEKDK